MNNMELSVDVALQIQKSAGEIFEAIVDPGKMINYFISESTGRMEEGKVLTWKFEEFDTRFPVRVGKITQDNYISFFWDSDGKELRVEISLSELKDGSTLVRISEGKKQNDEHGIKWLKGNTAGWAGFLACLKAYIEYGINLRKGSYDYMKDSGTTET
jgi:uncharacterized protein YndB with AHSA1/START domain